jgi:hypothetical protein
MSENVYYCELVIEKRWTNIPTEMCFTTFSITTAVYLHVSISCVGGCRSDTSFSSFLRAKWDFKVMCLMYHLFYFYSAISLWRRHDMNLRFKFYSTDLSVTIKNAMKWSVFVGKWSGNDEDWRGSRREVLRMFNERKRLLLKKFWNFLVICKVWENLNILVWNFESLLNFWDFLKLKKP